LAGTDRTDALVPLPDVRHGDIVLAGDPGKVVAAAYAVQDLLFFAGLVRRQVTGVLLFRIGVHRDEQVLARNDPVLLQIFSYSKHLDSALLELFPKKYF